MSSSSNNYWKITNLTSSATSFDVSFNGRGSIYAEGTFGGGTIQIKPIAADDKYGAKTVATGFIDSAIDGSVVKSRDVPSGTYRVILVGSTGASVNVFHRDQFDQIRGR